MVAANAAWANGLRKMENLAGKSVAITYLGSPFHYQLAQIARAKKFDFASITLKPMQTVDAAALAVVEGKADAAILPANYARELMVASQARLVGWYSEVGDKQQLGALFVAAKMIGEHRATVEKFVRAYRHGASDYSSMVQLDRYGKRIATVATREIATVIARYVYPGRELGRVGRNRRDRRLSDGPGGQARHRRRRAPGRLVQGAEADRRQRHHGQYRRYELCRRRLIPPQAVRVLEKCHRTVDERAASRHKRAPCQPVTVLRR